MSALESAEPALRVELLAPLLDDPVRAVRMEAARALAGAPRDRLTDAQRTALDRGLAEYVAAEQFNADRPESHLNLGLLYAAQRRLPEAEAALRTALEVDPRFAPASVNLADLYRATGRDAEGERVLRDALEQDPRSAAAHHALGLLLVRQKRMAEAMPELEAAARLAPESARYGYVYAVAAQRDGPAEAGDRGARAGARPSSLRPRHARRARRVRARAGPSAPGARLCAAAGRCSSRRTPRCASSWSGSRPRPRAEVSRGRIVHKMQAWVGSTTKGPWRDMPVGSRLQQPCDKSRTRRRCCWQCAKRPNGVRMREERSFVMIRWAALLLTTIMLAGPALAAELEGTLKKIKADNTITLGYREASRPFSFIGDDGKPAGYSVELCTRVAASIAKAARAAQSSGEVGQGHGRGPHAGGRQRHDRPRVRLDDRLAVAAGAGGLQPHDLRRRRQPAGHRRLGASAAISTLGGKRVAIIPGTTTEKSLNDALKKHAVTATLVPVKDHDAGVAALDSGAADAYASDYVILIGVGRTSKNPEKLSLVGEFFSYEPYGSCCGAATRHSGSRSTARSRPCTAPAKSRRSTRSGSGR